MSSAASKNGFDGLEASALVRRFASKIADNADGVPVLDVACGSGRNAFLLISCGCTVVCVDNNLVPLQNRLQLSRPPSAVGTAPRVGQTCRPTQPGGTVDVSSTRSSLRATTRGSGHARQASSAASGLRMTRLPTMTRRAPRARLLQTVPSPHNAAI